MRDHINTTLLRGHCCGSTNKQAALIVEILDGVVLNRFSQTFFVYNLKKYNLQKHINIDDTIGSVIYMSTQ